MINAIFDRIKKTQKQKIGVLLIIVALGIFLRGYNFRGLQRFDEDEVRDVVIVEQLQQDHNFLIMGPHAGGTIFDLGPAYYYMEYIALIIFGNDPGNLAYPTLLFSVLAIPLLYVFLKKFFTENISLAVTALYGVSFYAIKYARFAWNPNPLPFFILAFLLILGILVKDKKEPQIYWSVLLGIVIGIGIQLHTFIIVIFLPIAALYYGYFLWKKYPLGKSFVIAVFCVAFLNIPQFIHEVRTGGENSRAFVVGFVTKTSNSEPVQKYILKDLECYAQGSSYMLSAMNDDSNCLLFHELKRHLFAFYSNLILTLTFLFGGLILAVIKLKKEKDETKKVLLALSLIYAASSFLVFLPIALKFDARYCIIIFFVPFLLLGFWMDFFVEKFKIIGLLFVIVILGWLAVSNIVPVGKTYFSGLNPNHSGGGDFNGIVLTDAERISKFIALRSLEYPENRLYLLASQHKYLYAMNYFLSKQSNFKASELTKERIVEKNSILFSIVDNPNSRNYALQGYSEIDAGEVGTYDIFIMRKE